VPPKSRLASRLSPASPQGLRRLRFSFFLFTCQRTRWGHPSFGQPGLSPFLAAQKRIRRSELILTICELFSRGQSRSRRAAPPSLEAYIVGPLRHCQHLVTKKRRLVERSGPRTASGSPAFLPRALFAPKIGRVWRHAGCVAAVDGAGPRRQVPRRPSAPSRRASADRGDKRRS
jgi:hypothetical protein